MSGFARKAGGIPIITVRTLLDCSQNQTAVLVYERQHFIIELNYLTSNTTEDVEQYCIYFLLTTMRGRCLTDLPAIQEKRVPYPASP
jgi:hypothetical protein